VVIGQGQIWWADMPAPIGSGPGFRRPVVVVQGDDFNRSRIGTVVCVVLTSNVRLANVPGNVLLSTQATGLNRESVANVSQIVTLDKDSLTDYVGHVSRSQLQRILVGIDMVLGR
jgi:mRNA interferase MazF